MKRLVVGFVVGLLMAGVAATLAQVSAWQGQQWEYLILQTENGAKDVVILPMIGETSKDMGDYTKDIHIRALAKSVVFYGQNDEPFHYPFYLKVLGEDGWELAGVPLGGGGEIGQIFKRPKP